MCEEAIIWARVQDRAKRTGRNIKREVIESSVMMAPKAVSAPECADFIKFAVRGLADRELALVRVTMWSVLIESCTLAVASRILSRRAGGFADAPLGLRGGCAKR